MINYHDSVKELIFLKTRTTNKPTTNKPTTNTIIVQAKPLNIKLSTWHVPH